MTEPTSARIAAELRALIAAGELAPGDRVPSTRELVQRFGVAMATATKALTRLRQEGLVRSVRGVGTVVAEHARAARTPPPPGPAADRIVATAIRVADAEGIGTLSMRRVGAELGIATMSLYQHVPGKDDLLLMMIDRAFGEVPLPAAPPAGWRPALETAARTQWACFRRHPWLAAAMSLTRPQPVASALAHSEYVLAALDGRGLDTTAAFNVQIMLFSFVRGLAVNLETEAQAAAESGMDNDEWVRSTMGALTALVASGGFPMVQRVFALDFDLDLDGLFDLGLTCILDGLAGRLAGD